jgi:glycosyltransferase involved in cell wall biosynthesis
MAHGLPVVVSAVGGLVEAVEGYGGAVLVQPQDPPSLLDGIRRAAALRGRRFAVSHSWEASAASYAALARRLLDRPTPAPEVAEPAADAAR